MKESGIGIYSNGTCGHIITIPDSPLADGTISTAMNILMDQEMMTRGGMSKVLVQALIRS